MCLISTLALLSCVLVIGSGIGGPQSEVVPQQLHDQRRVLVRVLVQGVQLRDRVIEGLKQTRFFRKRYIQLNTIHLFG